MKNDFKRIVLTDEVILKTCKELGEKITDDYKDKELVIIGVLNGCYPFMADLLKNVNTSFEVDVIKASAYGDNTHCTYELKVSSDITCDIKGKHVVLVDEIIDTGFTLSLLQARLINQGAKSVECASLMQKDGALKTDLDIKYIGKIVENIWLTGYGLDYKNKYRYLPFVGVLEDGIIK